MQKRSYLYFKFFHVNVLFISRDSLACYFSNDFILSRMYHLFGSNKCCFHRILYCSSL